jgi:hypothetical protein
MYGDENVFERLKTGLNLGVSVMPNCYAARVPLGENSGTP